MPLVAEVRLEQLPTAPQVAQVQMASDTVAAAVAAVAAGLRLESVAPVAMADFRAAEEPPVPADELVEVVEATEPTDAHGSSLSSDMQINLTTKQWDDTDSHTGQAGWQQVTPEQLNVLIYAGSILDRFDADWQQELVKVWTDSVTGLTLRQDGQTRVIIAMIGWTLTEGLANGDLTGSTQVQLRDAAGVTRSGTVTQLRGVCYRYLKAQSANYVSKAP